MKKLTPIPDFALQSPGFAFGLLGEINRRLYAKAIEPLGITDQQLFVLTALDNLGPQVQAHLSEPIKIDKATMVGLINGLESKGLVERRPHPSDKRAVLVHITDVGRETLRRGYEISNQFAQKFFKGVTPEAQELFRTVLRQLATNTSELAEEFGLSE